MDETREKQLGQWLWQQRQFAGLCLPLSFLLGVLVGFSLMAQTLLLAKVLHGCIIEQQPISTFKHHLIALLLLLLVRALLVYGRERASEVAGRELRQQLRSAALDKLSLLGPAFIKNRPVGEWASLLVEQVESLQDYYARYLPQIGLTACLPLLILAFLFPINWAAAAILLCTAPLIPLFMTLVGMGAGTAHRKNFTALRRLGGHFMDRLQGLSTLKLFWRAEAEEAAIAQASDQFRQHTMAVLRLAFLSSAVLEFFAAISIAILALYFGFSYLGELNFGHYSTGVSLFSGLLALMLAPEFFQPLRDLGTHYHAKARAVGAAEALFDLLQTPEALPIGTQPLPANLNIVATDLTVFSLDGQRLLGPLSFELAYGQRLTLVGPSGAGKTSLLNCLLGFLPYAGSLQIGGVELNQLDLVAWRSCLGWLGQEPQLFHGSLRDNVALAQPEAEDEAIWKALEQVDMAEFVRSQPQGLEAALGERSAGLSVGQAQRVALARALLQDVRVFVLDEPTASLDAHHEECLLTALSEAWRGKSCLLATHRLDRLAASDELLVLAQGQLVQRGSFATLAATPGLLAQMLAESSAEVEGA